MCSKMKPCWPLEGKTIKWHSMWFQQPRIYGSQPLLKTLVHLGKTWSHTNCAASGKVLSLLFSQLRVSILLRLLVKKFCFFFPPLALVLVMGDADQRALHWWFGEETVGQKWKSPGTCQIRPSTTSYQDDQQCSLPRTALLSSALFTLPNNFPGMRFSTCWFFYSELHQEEPFPQQGLAVVRLGVTLRAVCRGMKPVLAKLYLELASPKAWRQRHR